MKSYIFAFLLIVITGSSSCQNKNHKTMEFKKLTPEEEQVIINKGTERPFTGEFVNTKEDGSYTCKRCGSLLFSSESKFDSHCGWPSFDDEIKGAVTRTLDADGRRTEITCNNCGAHLGHVFVGEHLTQKDTREASVNVANHVLKSFMNVSPLHKDTVQKAGFMVLKSPDIPSILVETAFISNPSEEQNLLSEQFQTKIAKAIFKGLVNYFSQSSSSENSIAVLEPLIRG